MLDGVVALSGAEQALVLLAGVGAGTINTVVGSGSLVTFPTLVALGLPPVTANVSNSLGLVPGALAGALGYRRELAGQGGRVRRLLPASMAAGALGAVLLLVLPAGAFNAVVPALVAVAVVLVVVQPRLARRLRERDEPGTDRDRVRPTMYAGVGATGVYGGYFGAAQGVLLLAVLGITGSAGLQRDNAVKNVLALATNSVAAMIFVFTATLNWRAVLLIAIGSTLGGALGARIGRRLPQPMLRAIVVVVGVVAFVFLLVR